MKRLIRYHNRYEGDGAAFSDCSTKYTVLPVLVADDASAKELVAAARNMEGQLPMVTEDMVIGPGIAAHPVFNATHIMKQGGEVTPTGKPAVEWRPQHGPHRVTHAVQIGEVEEADRSYAYQQNVKKLPEYLGFITLERSELKPSKRPGKKLTAKQSGEIVGNQEFGVDSVGEQVDGKIIVVKSGWNYYCGLELHGYSLESFQKAEGITEEGFHDDTSSCSSCGKFDSNDDGRTTNFREVDGEYLGINCGCYGEACMTENALEDYTDNQKKGMELEFAHKWMEQGRLKFVERYMGGWTDPGRGGYWGGGDERNGMKGSYGSCMAANPDTVVKEWKEKNPKGHFVVSHDESGQFQSYWSLWQVMDEEAEAEVKETARKVNQILKGYVACALWSSNDESDESGGVPLDKNYGPKDVTEGTMEEMRKDCEKFLADNADDIEEFVRVTKRDLEHVGHDLWLTRNGHGAGFWDRDAGEVGDRLTEACKELGEVNLWVDGGRVHV